MNHRHAKSIFVSLLIVLLLSSFAFASSGKSGGSDEANYIQDELLIKFKPGVPDHAKGKAHGQQGSKKIKGFKSIGVDHVKLKKGLSVEEAIEKYMATPNVEYAEPNYRYHALESVPNDPFFSELWGMKNTGQTGGTPGADINATSAWDVTTGDSSLVVAVIDSGIDYNHVDIADNLWTNSAELNGVPSVDDDGNGYIDDIYGINPVYLNSNPMDDHGHGTHCAGTIGAVGNNSVGVAGVNWDVQIMACKFLDSAGYGSASGAIECLDYISNMKDQGIDVVATNNSWGGGPYSQALLEAIGTHLDRGILFVAAAGNDALNNDIYDVYPTNYDLPNIISVAATDHNDEKAGFSSYGKSSVEVGAPGVDVVSLRAAGTDMYGDGLHFIPDGDPNAEYYRASGTSMAAPHVSGLAALIKAANPARNWSEIKNLIMIGGDNTPAMSQLTITGKRINAYGSLNCTDSPVLTVNYPDDYTIGQPETLSALSINCGAPVGPVTVTTSMGGSIVLLDDGVAPDTYAGDGIFTGVWTPTVKPEVLTFSSGAGTQTVTTPALKIDTTPLPNAPINKLYSSFISVSGGFAPYTFSVVPGAGNLPEGLAINSVSGEISGIPTTEGISYFIVLVTDAHGSTKTNDYSIHTYFGNDLEQAWGRSYDFGTTERSNGIAADSAGNIYVVGDTSTASPISDLLIIKYDPSGNELWSRYYDSGGMDYAEGIAVDGSGNVYVTGYCDAEINSDGLTVKYDTDGNLQWAKRYEVDSGNRLFDIAVDDDGNVYATGEGNRRPYGPDFLTIKYNTRGRLQWSAYHEPVSDFPGYGHYSSRSIALDGNGDIYVVGHNSYDNGHNTLKYDSRGNLLWSQDFAATSGGRSKFISIAADASGNAYIAAYTQVNGEADFLTYKYDAQGNLLWSDVRDTGMVDYAQDIAVDASGNAYVTGFVLEPINDSVYIYTGQYSASGEYLGAQAYTHGSFFHEFFDEVFNAVDDAGNVFVASFERNTTDDILLIKYTQGQLPGGPVIDSAVCDGVSALTINGTNFGTFSSGTSDVTFTETVCTGKGKNKICNDVTTECSASSWADSEILADCGTCPEVIDINTVNGPVSAPVTIQ